MASPAAPATKLRAPFPLGDELLEEIFFRLPSPADLARASAACASFRRIITDRSFLRRFRNLHPPPLLGFVNSHGFHPAQPPYASAPLAGALASAADFSYSFIPLPYGIWGPRWLFRDVRDGRVLLECSSFGEGKDISTNLVVCDPLSRRYVLLPRIHDDLTLPQDRLFEFASFLAPIGDDEEETSFKVIGMAQYKSKLVLFVFSSVTREWCIAASPTWSSLGMVAPSERIGLSYFDYLHGCFYWAAHWGNKLLVLDVRRMEFSTISITTGSQMQRGGWPHVVMAGEGALGMCTLVCDFVPHASNNVLYHTTQQNKGESSKQWQLERCIPLAGQYVFNPAGATEGFLFIEGAPIDDIPVPYLVSLPENWDLYYFSLDVKTSELKKVCRTRLYPNEGTRVHPYFGFPPSLSKPCL